jgi:hypothetical protein
MPRDNPSLMLRYFGEGLVPFSRSTHLFLLRCVTAKTSDSGFGMTAIPGMNMLIKARTA